MEEDGKITEGSRRDDSEGGPDRPPSANNEDNLYKHSYTNEGVKFKSPQDNYF